MPKTLISLFLKSSISVLSVLSTQLASAETTLVAVASNFIQPAQALVDAFNSQQKTQQKTPSGHQARLVSGSSGKLYAQIIHGAPYDLFFSADQIKPQQLSDKGLTADNSQYTYAAGLLVFAVRVPDSTEGSAKSAEQRLREGDFQRLAIANPDLAPYGLAATEVLQRLALDKSYRLITAENINQCWHFIQTGNADASFVALSQLSHAPDNSELRYWQIPENWYSPINQDAVLLKRSVDNPAAQAFWQFMQSKNARDIIHSYGYRLP